MAGLNLFCAFSPSEKRFAFLRRPQITLEAFSMIGEALRCETYHTGKTRQENFIRKIWINTIRLRNLESGNSRKSFTKKPGLVGLIAPALAQRFQRVLIFPWKSHHRPSPIGRPPGSSLNAGRAMSAPKRVTREPLKERAELSRKFLYGISTEE